MASLSVFVIERHSRVWLLRLLIHRSHQSKLPILSGMEWENADGHSLKYQLLEGFIIRRKVAVMASFSLFLNECPLKVLVVVPSDLPKLSNKIACPEWNRMEKKLMVTV